MFQDDAFCLLHHWGKTLIFLAIFFLPIVYIISRSHRTSVSVTSAVSSCSVGGFQQCAVSWALVHPVGLFVPCSEKHRSRWDVLYTSHRCRWLTELGMEQSTLAGGRSFFVLLPRQSHQARCCGNQHWQEGPGQLSPMNQGF